MEGCLPLSVAILGWGCMPETPASRTVSEHTFLLWNSRANVLTQARGRAPVFWKNLPAQF